MGRGRPRRGARAFISILLDVGEVGVMNLSLNLLFSEDSQHNLLFGFVRVQL